MWGIKHQIQFKDEPSPLLPVRLLQVRRLQQGNGCSLLLLSFPLPLSPCSAFPLFLVVISDPGGLGIFQGGRSGEEDLLFMVYPVGVTLLALSGLNNIQNTEEEYNKPCYHVYSRMCIILTFGKFIAVSTINKVSLYICAWQQIFYFI